MLTAVITVSDDFTFYCSPWQTFSAICFLRNSLLINECLKNFHVVKTTFMLKKSGG